MHLVLGAGFVIQDIANITIVVRENYSPNMGTDANVFELTSLHTLEHLDPVFQGLNSKVGLTGGI